MGSCPVTYLLSCQLLQGFVLVVSVLLATIYYYFGKRDSRISEFIDKFPGPKPKFFWGNVAEISIPNEEILNVAEKRGNEYGRVHRLWFMNRPYVGIMEATAAEKILSSSVYINKPSDYDAIIPWLGTGLLISKGTKWFNRRKLITPTFHFKILEDFLEIFNEQSSHLVQILQDKSESKKVFDIFPFVTRCVLDIICETAMGKKINAQYSTDSEYLRAVLQISEIIIYRSMRPWLRVDWVWALTSYGRKEKEYLKILHSFTNSVIKERKKELKDKMSNSDISEDNGDKDNIMNRKKRTAFLDLLIEASQDGKFLSDEDIREETDTFMFEGHDTTAAHICWTILLLANNPVHQEKVYKEIEETFSDDISREIKTADLAKMKYLDLCIKESLRIYPSVPFISRGIDQDLPLDNGLVIPKGAIATVFPYLIHRDESVFPNPEEFKPERFLPDNCVGRNAYAYVPFSAGPRNCIGQKFAVMESKVVLINILRNFKIIMGDRREDVKILPELIIRPKNGIKVKLVPRE